MVNYMGNKSKKIPKQTTMWHTIGDLHAANRSIVVPYQSKQLVKTINDLHATEL